MRTLIVLFCLVLTPICSFAQSDTVYFDRRPGSGPREVPRSEAKFFRPPLIKENDRYKIEEYYISGKLKMEGYVISPDSMLYDGYAIEYYENGHKKEFGNYWHGARIGQWKMKYEDTDRVWVARTYYNSKSDTTEVLRSFYRSGKLKRVEYIMRGKLLFKFKGDKTYDYVDTGLSYSETGVQIPYSPFELMPEPGFDINNYLAQNIRYPDEARENNIQGRVNVQFAVTKDGDITEISIVKSFEVSLAKEAIRVVKNMPKWKPGMQDGLPVKVYYTLPISFLLE